MTNTKRKKILFRSVVTSAVVVLLAMVLVIRKSRADVPDTQIEALAAGDVESVISASGTLNPIEVVEIGSEVSGRIIKLNADFNSRVKAGQIVAELDQDALKGKVLSAEASLLSARAALNKARLDEETAKKVYDRRLSLYERREVSEQDRESAEADYVAARVAARMAQSQADQAGAQLDSSRIALSHAVIRSPIDGIVLTRAVNVGQTVAAGYSAPVLFKVASDLVRMQIECAIDEADIGKLKEGQKVRFTVGTEAEEAYEGSIRQIRNAAVTTSNVTTYTAVVDADNSRLTLKPGMTASLTVVLEEARNVLRVPNAALKYTPPGVSAGAKARADAMRKSLLRKQGLIWVVDGAGVFEPRVVGLGVEGGTHTEIRAAAPPAGTKFAAGAVTGASAAGSGQSVMMPPPPMDGGGPPPPSK